MPDMVMPDTVKVRRLRELAGVGPSIERNLNALGINAVDQLATADPDSLYERLSELEGKRQDPCVLDTFRCAVAQAQNPNLSPERRNWWWWSQQRKQAPPEPRRSTSRSAP